MLKFFGATAAAIGAVITMASANAAQFVVLEAHGSIAATLSAGAVIDDAAINVPAHDQLTVMGGDGQAIEINGPHQGPIDQATHADSGMLTKIAQAMQDRPAAFGAARGAGFPPPPIANKDDPWAVDATMGGTACFFEGRKALLWKPATAEQVHLAIRDDTTNKGAGLDWPANQSAAPWPTDLPIIDGDRYSVSLDDKHRTITVKTVSAAASPGLGSLLAANAGCTTQATTLIKAVKPARVVPPS